jgi:hypothetical protein
MWHDWGKINTYRISEDYSKEKIPREGLGIDFKILLK